MQFKTDWKLFLLEDGKIDEHEVQIWAIQLPCKGKVLLLRINIYDGILLQILQFNLRGILF